MGSDGQKSANGCWIDSVRCPGLPPNVRPVVMSTCFRINAPIEETGGTGNQRHHAFGSYHEGGCFFAFCDGQVRFISENIDTTTYRALSTRDNNEVIDDEDY